jgi:hypothetical protein
VAGVGGRAVKAVPTLMCAPLTCMPASWCDKELIFVCQIMHHLQLKGGWAVKAVPMHACYDWAAKSFERWVGGAVGRQGASHTRSSAGLMQCWTDAAGVGGWAVRQLAIGRRKEKVLGKV